jgi:L-alanine-DL-glutamate epimerase-like enolase superfamily enzyme
MAPSIGECVDLNIEAVDFYYLSMPQILDIGDGSQDLLLVRLQAGAYVGWGECEASPLVSIASLVAPMSHSACKPVRDSVLGQTLDGVEDIRRIGDHVRANSLDLLQTDHTLSGIDIAMWDLLGKRFQVPSYELLGYKQTFPKTPYASVLFGDTPQETLEKGRNARAAGYAAAKFGWGPYGAGSVEADTDQVAAAREGLGPDGILLVDAGTVWKDDLDAARLRLPALKEFRATWLEEPFLSGALESYGTLAGEAGPVKLAGGEGSHNTFMAKHMIDYGGIGFVQIDAGRIGGVTPAREIALYATARGVTYVNHTFTSHLALAASLLPFADLPDHTICEYPVEPKALALDATLNHLERDANGQISLPDQPGLGIQPNLTAAKNYLVETEIRVAGKTLYATPELRA